MKRVDESLKISCTFHIFLSMIFQLSLLICKLLDFFRWDEQTLAILNEWIFYSYVRKTIKINQKVINGYYSQQNTWNINQLNIWPINRQVSYYVKNMHLYTCNRYFMCKASLEILRQMQFLDVLSKCLVSNLFDNVGQPNFVIKYTFLTAYCV